MTAPDRRPQVIAMRQQGLTFREISERLGVTRQRCQQILVGDKRPRKTDMRFSRRLSRNEEARERERQYQEFLAEKKMLEQKHASSPK